MQYLKDLESIVKINSYTKNKIGVDKVGQLFDKWLLSLGYKVTVDLRNSFPARVNYFSPRFC